MGERYDWIAVGPYGAYALLDAGLASVAEVAEFKADAERQGHTFDLVTVSEAVRRHRDFLERGFLARAQAGIGMPAYLPSPAQLDLFAGASSHA